MSVRLTLHLRCVGVNTPLDHPQSLLWIAQPSGFGYHPKWNVLCLFSTVPLMDKVGVWAQLNFTGWYCCAWYLDTFLDDWSVCWRRVHDSRLTLEVMCVGLVTWTLELRAWYSNFTSASLILGHPLALICHSLQSAPYILIGTRSNVCKCCIILLLETPCSLVRNVLTPI